MAASHIGAMLGLRCGTLSPPDWPDHMDFITTSWLSLVLLAVRLVSERIMIPIIKSRCTGDKPGKTAAALFDNAFIAVLAGALEASAVYITLFANHGCTPWATDACIVGWPDHPIDVVQRLYFIFMFQYYLYEMLSTALGVGSVLKTEMVVHHVATMSLIACAYSINLVRYGTMWQALFDASNPLLHVAKFIHIAEVPVLKDIMLPIFAVFFFIVRIAAAPMAVAVPAFQHAAVVLPRTWAVTMIGLMCFVCALQWFWFYKIIQIAMKSDAQKEEAIKKETEKKES